ncbi:hypothetical protein AWW66_24260 [Micromonospora rosaria]|uniref:Uncharacterized protein n=1 Tax=Micromonospora rosaria TaxID=47874 RepID=A0A136PLZ4_9ACTN|nr:hypothetical protein [Micromonospora rosaria]KXK59424.1 hypothetical protein AWW66_24260 [Micromonospora rosaria]
MSELRAGDLLHLTRAASLQFGRPILFRLIRVQTDWITYDGWVWLDGYQLDDRGDAVARRSVFVQRAGIRTLTQPPRTVPDQHGRRSRRRTAGGR